MVVIRATEPQDVEECVAVLASLPDYFTPDTHDEVRAGWARQPGWVALRDEQVVGFEDGVAVAEVKTLDASAGYEPYVATRAFWERCGFHQIDCIDPLPGWQPGNPAAIYVAALTATR